MTAMCAVDSKVLTLVLGSSSPRRKALLAGLGLDAEAVAPRVDEVRTPGEPAAAFALRLAQDKARDVADRLPAACRPALVIAADTIVVLEEEILGKPADTGEARRMLRALSGRSHRVMTGMHLARVESGGLMQEEGVLVSTDVTFKRLSEKEISDYIASGEPMDKAGAYGIQGGANYMVRSISGSYTNVVGLPLCELVELLQTVFGYTVL